MEKIETPLPGAFLVRPPLFTDQRGGFVKTFHRDIFQGFGVAPVFVEEFYSTSAQGVIRGMHFQTPPADHAKYVCCLVGAVRDVILDLRKGSPTYGRHHAVELSAENRLGFYIPSGFAHGFLSLTQGAMMLYKTTSVHTPACDAGILWDGFGYDWGLTAPTVSARDAAFPALERFTSPFTYDAP
jgi:dTDP-4-dehydrorhamnose 3,5-epimerase